MWKSELAFPMLFTKYYLTPLYISVHPLDRSLSFARSLQSNCQCVCRHFVKNKFKRTYLMKICFSLFANCKFISCLLCVALLVVTYSFTLFQQCARILNWKFCVQVEKHAAVQFVHKSRARESVAKEFPSYSRLCPSTMHTIQICCCMFSILLRIIVELIAFPQLYWSATNTPMPFITPMCTISRNSDCKNWVNIHCFC